MKCYNHGDIEAVGVCTSCGKAVCNQCEISINNKLMCKSCVSDAINNKSSAPNLLNQIVRYLDLIISSFIVGIIALFDIFLLLIGSFTAFLLCSLILAVAAFGLYTDYKKKKYSTSYSVFTIIVYGVILLIVILGIVVIGTVFF